MRRGILAAIALCLLSLGPAFCSEKGNTADSAVTAPRTYEIGDPIPSKRVAVMNLKVTGEYSDQLREWLPALIEDRLLAEGWTLVVRGDRMRHIQEERNLPGIKPETGLPENELLGASALIELSARIRVKDTQGVVGYKVFTVGDYSRATVDLNGQVVDPATGVLKSSVNVGGSASGLKTALVVAAGRDFRVGVGGYNIQGIRQTLVGKAADQAAEKLVARLKSLYPSVPSGTGAARLQPYSTTVAVEPAPVTILMDLPKSSDAQVGDRYGIYREDKLIAEVEIVRLVGSRAQARIIAQSEAIKPTDIARRMPMVIKAQ